MSRDPSVFGEAVRDPEAVEKLEENWLQPAGDSLESAEVTEAMAQDPPVSEGGEKQMVVQLRWVATLGGMGGIEPGSLSPLLEQALLALVQGRQVEEAQGAELFPSGDPGEV